MALDATVLSTGNYCLQAFSKNVFARQESEDEINKTCEKLNCTTLTHSQVLVLNLTPADCDSEFSKRFNGEILIKNLVTVLLPFPSRHGRGVHAADFDWNLEGGISARGNFQGITNAGIVRPPVAGQQCELCTNSDILTGHLFATVSNVPSIPTPEFFVDAVYRFNSLQGRNIPHIGTIEGVIIMRCP